MSSFRHLLVLVLLIAALGPPGLLLATCRHTSAPRCQGCDSDPPVLRLEARPPAEKLPVALRPAEGDRKVQFLVDLAVQADLTALGRRLAARKTGRAERRDVVIAALGRVAEGEQTALRPTLEALRSAGLVESYRGFWVINRLVVEGTVKAAQHLAEREEVARIVAETEFERPTWTGDPVARVTPTRRRSWALDAIGVGAAWAAGLDGSGVVVGIIDSGASSEHEQLRAGFVGPGCGWRDPKLGTALPRDGVFGHGTGVLSCAVGRNAAGIVLGVAPGAHWAACAGLPEGRYNNVLLTECADWMLREARPDVLINAWLLPDAVCDRSLEPIVDAWRAAEILPVFPAGRAGPRPGVNHSPANYAGLYPGAGVALSVGGWSRGGALLGDSSRGPGACDPGAVFPSLVAPADDLVTAMPLTASAYRQAAGTSFAAGLAAGAAAILLQRHPEASVTELETALRLGAVDLGAAGPDPESGHGRLDIPGALRVLGELRRAAERDR